MLRAESLWILNYLPENFQLLSKGKACEGGSKVWRKRFVFHQELTILILKLWLALLQGSSIFQEGNQMVGWRKFGLSLKQPVAWTNLNYFPRCAGKFGKFGHLSSEHNSLHLPSVKGPAILILHSLPGSENRVIEDIRNLLATDTLIGTI